MNCRSNSFYPGITEITEIINLVPGDNFNTKVVLKI